MTERVTGEDLAPQHDEVTDEPRSERNGSSRDEGVAQERLLEHVSDPNERIGCQQHHVASIGRVLDPYECRETIDR